MEGIAFPALVPRQVQAQKGGTAAALAAALREVQRVRVHGLSAREISSAKRQLMVSMNCEFRERHNAQSYNLVDAAVQHFLGHSDLGSTEYKQRLTAKVLGARRGCSSRCGGGHVSPAFSAHTQQEYMWVAATDTLRDALVPKPLP